MPENNNDSMFSGEYSPKQTTADMFQTTATGNSSTIVIDKIDSEIYGTKKPKRIIFKANLINEDS